MDRRVLSGADEWIERCKERLRGGCLPSGLVRYGTSAFFSDVRFAESFDSKLNGYKTYKWSSGDDRVAMMMAVAEMLAVDEVSDPFWSLYLSIR